MIRFEKNEYEAKNREWFGEPADSKTSDDQVAGAVIEARPAARGQKPA